LVNRTKLYLSPKYLPIQLQNNENNQSINIVETNVIQEPQLILSNTSSTAPTNFTAPTNSTAPTNFTAPTNSTASTNSTAPTNSTVSMSSIGSLSAIDSIGSSSIVDSYTSSSNILSSNNSSLNTQISSSFNNSISLQSSGFTIQSDDIEIIDLEAFNSSKNNDDINNFIDEILTQLQVDNCVFGMNMITIQNTTNVVENIINWIKTAKDTDLLKKPFFSVVDER